MSVAAAVPASVPASVPAAFPVPSPAPNAIVTEGAFCDWLGAATAGDRIEYYRGHLAYDRTPSARVLADRDRTTLAAVARRALKAADEDRVHLVQRRHGDCDYSYFAVMAKQLRRTRRR
jgi:hypothetical protein